MAPQDMTHLTDVFNEVGVDAEAMKYDEMMELGQTGLKRFGGVITEEFLTTLMGQRAAEVYREMSTNDPVVSGMLHVVDMMIRQSEWTVEPGDGPRSEEAAEFIEEAMHDMADSWEDTISEVLSMLVYGYSLHEIVYKKRQGEQLLAVDENGQIVSTPDSKFKDGKIGWHRLAVRAQDTIISWAIDGQSGEILGAWQQAPPNFKLTFIPMEKGLLFRTLSHKNNPEGKSILRGAYRPWYFKKRIEEIEAIGIERDLAGLPVLTDPPEYFSSSATAEQKAVFEELKQIVTNIRRDEQEGVLLPMAYDPDTKTPLFELKLLSTGGSRQFDTDTIINRYDQRITLAALADFLLVGHQNVGSFALHDDKTNLFGVATGAWLDTIAATLNRTAVPRLLRLNGFPTEDPPKIVHGDIESPDLNKMATYLQTLSGIGMPLFPDDTLEQHLRDLAHLPAKSEDAEATSQLMIQQESSQAELEALRAAQGQAEGTDSQGKAQDATEAQDGPVQKAAEVFDELFGA